MNKAPWYKDIIDAYPILYVGKNKPMSESLMCFGFECGEGWKTPLNKLSYILEQLNVQHKKDRLRIEAVQVKEKFATLRYYYDVHIDDPLWQKIIRQPFAFLKRYIDTHVNFHVKFIIDEPEHNVEEWTKISKKDYDNKKILDYVDNSFGWKFKKEGNEYFRNCDVTIAAKGHYEPQKHKWLKYISTFLGNMSRWLYFYSPSNALRQKQLALDDIVHNYVMKTEEECTKLCETCGRQIGTTYSPICCTVGYITYICEDCAKKSSRMYVMNNKTYKNGKVVRKSK